MFAGLFLLLAGTGVAAIRAARRAKAAAAAAAAAAAGVPTAATGTGAAGQGAAADRVVGWLCRVMPFGSLVMAAIVPLAAGLYLLTTATWTLAERAAINRWSRVAQRSELGAMPVSTQHCVVAAAQAVSSPVAAA